MPDLFNRAVELIKSEGFTGAHSFIFLTRYAYLSGDKALMELTGNTMSSLDDVPASAALAYALCEYYEATGAEFCVPAAEYVISSALSSGESRMLMCALAKAGRVFNNERYLVLARELAEDDENEKDAFYALGLLELYRATYFDAYLSGADEIASVVLERFHSRFDPADAYDLALPSANSASAVLFDELYRLTQKPKWKKARENQNRFVSMLSDKYPTAATFGLNALLSDEFEWKTVICRFPEGCPPEELGALLSFYSPLTEFIISSSDSCSAAEYYELKDGVLRELRSGDGI